MYHIYIGYDEREHEVYQACKHSIIKNTKSPEKIKIHKLAHRPLREQGLLTREWKIESNGQYKDLVDGRPFSTQFTFSRFLVPTLWETEDSPKSNLCLFVDCDFVFTSDIVDLFEDIEKNPTGSPLHVVKHNYKPQSTTKMDNMVQCMYNMKLWAAFMIFDMSYSENEQLTPEVVNTASGRDLMAFCWISNKDNIGEIPEAWHFIPGHSEKRVSRYKAVHFTEGGPWFPHLNGKCVYDHLWWNIYGDFLLTKVTGLKFNLEELIYG